MTQPRRQRIQQETATTGPTDLDFSDEIRQKLADPSYDSPLVNWAIELQPTDTERHSLNVFRAQSEEFFTQQEHRGRLYTLKAILGSTFQTLVKDGQLEFIIYESEFRELTKQNRKKVKDLRELGYTLEPVVLFNLVGGGTIFADFKVKKKIHGLIIDGVGVATPRLCYRVVSVDIAKNQREVLARDRKIANAVQKGLKRK